MSQPKWQTPLLLATALFVASSAAFWFEFKKKPAEDRAAEQSKKLFSLSDRQVSVLSFKAPGKPEVTLSCLELATGQCKAGSLSRWELLKPIKSKADDSNVQSLLSSLNNMAPTASISLVEEPAEQRPALLRQYGLEKSQLEQAYSVEVTNDGNAAPSKLWIGGLHPMGDSRYAMIESDPTQIRLLPKDVVNTFEQAPSHWREKRFVPLSASQVTSILVEDLGSPKTRIQAEHTEATQPWLLSGRDAKGLQFKDLPGDAESINSWLSSIVFLTATEFAAEQKASTEGRAALAGSKALLRIELQAGKGTTFEFEIRERKTKGSTQLLAVSKQIDPVFKLDGEAASRLRKTAKDLQLAKLLGSMDRFNTKKITVQSKALGPGPIELTADSKISELLEKLSGNRILAWSTADAATVQKANETGLRISLFELKANQPQLIRELLFWKSGTKLMAMEPASKPLRALEIQPEVDAALPWNLPATGPKK